MWEITGLCNRIRITSGKCSKWQASTRRNYFSLWNIHSLTTIRNNNPRKNVSVYCKEMAKKKYNPESISLIKRRSDCLSTVWTLLNLEVVCVELTLFRVFERYFQLMANKGTVRHRNGQGG